MSIQLISQVKFHYLTDSEGNSTLGQCKDGIAICKVMASQLKLSTIQLKISLTFHVYVIWFISRLAIILLSFFFKSKISLSLKLQLKNAIKSNYWGGLGKIFNLEKLEIQSVQDLGKSSQLKPWSQLHLGCIYITSKLQLQLQLEG